MSGPFKLRSGNATPFKQMGSSPMKQDDVESYNKEQKAKYDADLKKYQEDLKSHQDSTASYNRTLKMAEHQKKYSEVSEPQFTEQEIRDAAKSESSLDIIDHLSSKEQMYHAGETMRLHRENIESGVHPDIDTAEDPKDQMGEEHGGASQYARIFTEAAKQVKPGPAPVEPKEPTYMVPRMGVKKIKIEEKEQEPTKTKKKYIKTKKKGEYIKVETGEKVKIGGKSKKSKKKKRVKKRRTKNLVTGGINITE